jgi:hypothetical protein
VTVTQAQIDRVRQTGIINVEYIADACNKTGCRFYLAVTMIDKETKGRNIYGNDVGGVLSGFKDGVNRDNYRALRHEVLVRGRTPNGVGPAQITHPDLLREMEGRSLNPYDAAMNIFFGVERIYKFYRHARDEMDLSTSDAWYYAGKRYNGSAEYADDFRKRALEWKNRVGSADYS